MGIGREERGEEVGQVKRTLMSPSYTVKDREIMRKVNKTR